MSQKRAVRAQIRSLQDLRHVVEAMQNLALAEIGRLARTAQARHTLLDSLAKMASELAYFYPPLFIENTLAPTLYILIGSQRGLCGDLNESMARSWRSTCSQQPVQQLRAIVVGARLSDKLETHDSILSQLPGPITAIDIDSVLTEVARCTGTFTESLRGSSYRLVALSASASGVSETLILPFKPPLHPKDSAVPPDINLAPPVLVSEFIQYYIDAALHEVLSSSLVYENRLRLERMTSALEHIDRRCGELTLRLNRERQENITREIETILLSVNQAEIAPGNHYEALRDR